MNKKQKFIELTKSGGICGILLLIRPLIYSIFSRRRDLNAYAAIDLTAIIFIIYALICFFAAWRVLSKQSSSFGRKVMTHTPMIWFLIYTVYGFISMLWSVNFTLTGFRAFECMAMILLIVAIMQTLFTTCNTDKIIDWVILYITIDIIFALLRTLQWSTSFYWLTQSSQMVSTVFFFMALYYPKKKWYHYLIIIMALFSGSTVAYIGMAAGMISIFWRKTKYKSLLIAASITICLFIAIIGPNKVLKNTVFHDKESISLEDTSGRDVLMEISIESIKKNPFGLGFFSGEPFLLRRYGHNAINVHNSIFSAGIGMGYIGIVFITIFLFGIGITVFSKYVPVKYKASLIGCFLVGFLHCMGNPALGSRVYGAWLPVTFLFTLICSFYVYGKYYKRP